MTNKTNTTTPKINMTITASPELQKVIKEMKPTYTLGDTVEYLQGTYEVVEVLSEGVHLKNAHEPFNSEVVKYSELTQG